MKLIKDIKENWKLILAFLTVTPLLGFLVMLIIGGSYNLLVWVTPYECHEYRSWEEIIIAALSTAAVTLTFLIFFFILHIFHYPLSWISSNLPPMPKKLKSILEKRKEKVREKNFIRCNKKPTWFDKNEATIALILFIMVVTVVFITAIVEFVKFYYCL